VFSDSARSVLSLPKGAHPVLSQHAHFQHTINTSTTNPTQPSKPPWIPAVSRTQKESCVLLLPFAPRARAPPQNTFRPRKRG
jgi:hypothetical protein